MAANCYLLQNTTKTKQLKINLEEDFIIGRKELKPIGYVAEVSRKHALFHVDSDGNWSIKDLDSTNGVYVNKEQIGPGFYPLKNGDIIGFGVSDEFSNGEFDFLFCSGEKNVPSQEKISSHTLTPDSAKSDENHPRSSCHVKSICSHLDSSNSTITTETLPRKKPSLHYTQKYSHILNSEFPKVVVKKCKIPGPLRTSRKKKLPFDDQRNMHDETQPVKRRKIIKLSDSSGSNSNALAIVPRANDGKYIDFAASIQNLQFGNCELRLGAMPIENASYNANENTQILCSGSSNKNIEASSPCAMQLEKSSEGQVGVPNKCNENVVSTNKNDPQCVSVYVKAEKHSDSDDDCQIVSYSQEYEVIVISDDEEYFSIPASQLATSVIKTEPQDDEIIELHKNFEDDMNVVEISSSPCLFTVAEVQSLGNNYAKGAPEKGSVSNIKNCIKNNSASCKTKSTVSNREQGNALPELTEKLSSPISPAENALMPYKVNVSKYNHAVNDLEQKRDIDECHNNILSGMQCKLLQNLDKTTNLMSMGKSQCFSGQRKNQKHSGDKSLWLPMEPTHHFISDGSALNKNARNNTERLHLKTANQNDPLKKDKKQPGHTTPVIPENFQRGWGNSNVKATSVNLNKPSAIGNNVFDAQSLSERQRCELVVNKSGQQPSSNDIPLTTKSKCSTTQKSIPERDVFNPPKFINSAANEPSRVNSSLNVSRNQPLYEKHIERTQDPKKKYKATLCQDQKKSNFSSVIIPGENILPIATVQPISAPSSTKTCDSGTLRSVQFKTRFISNDVNHHSASIQPLTDFDKSRDTRLQARTQPESNDPCRQDLRNKVLRVQNFLVHDSLNVSYSKLAAVEQVDFDTLLAEILRWNPAWLRQYEQCKSPPPSIVQGVVPIPLNFDSFRDYVLCFYSLIRLEIWESIFRCWKAGSTSTVFFMVAKCETQGDLMTLECESVVSSSTPQTPHYGCMMTVDLRTLHRKEAIKLFGYVTSHTVVAMPNGDSLHQEWRQRPEIHDKNSKFLVFILRMKKITMPIDLNKLMKASVMNYIASEVRIVSTFQHMMSSPITPCILHPTIEAYRLNTSFSQSNFPGLLGYYNEQQRSAVLSICSEVQLPDMIPKIMLLQGPPGTGKTHTIVGIVQALHSKQHKVKILVTAPSNAAVDEIARRLIGIRQISDKGSSLSDLRIIRVGIRRTHKDVLPFTLEEQAKYNSKKNLKNTEMSLQREYDKVTEDISLLKNTIKEMEAGKHPLNDIRQKRNELNMKSRCKERIGRELNEATAKYTDLKYLNCHKLKMEILAKADVILTTLSSCSLKILESVFGPKSGVRFSCCIVDEISQCIEPEIFQPLVFGITKFILVGDHQQLPPTFQSNLAASCYFERSFCERVHAFFEVNYQRSLLPSTGFMLTTQFRMHSEICAFPSINFYSNMLSTAQGVDSNYSQFPFKPFIMIDMPHKSNVYEAAILEICTQLIESIPKDYSIGVITPNPTLKFAYQKALSSGSANHVEINLVDGFQGREKDVIILPCMRSNSSAASGGFLTCTKRMNVAMTRAKQCLIICGHMKSLKHYPAWASLISYAKSKNCRVPITDTLQISHVFNKIKKTR